MYIYIYIYIYVCVCIFLQIQCLCILFVGASSRLYDQVKQQIDIMQSRMVRKIEWRVESASLLRKCFPPNECLCSTTFSAAGIEGMQSLDQNCSAFIKVGTHDIRIQQSNQSIGNH